MRVTNSMINRNNLTNINSNKTTLDKMFVQMSSHKKIQNASEDPVIAIRALRLRSTLSEISQYYDKNIPDAESWLKITEDAVNNIKEQLKDIKTKCEYGKTTTLNQTNRKALLDEIKQLKEHIYSELNADEAGRTVFSGFKTNKTVSLTKDDSNMDYTITEKLSYTAIEDKNYYANAVDINEVQPTVNAAPEPDKMTKQVTNNRIRLSYGQMEGGTNTLKSFTYTIGEKTQKRCTMGENGNVTWETGEKKESGSYEWTVDNANNFIVKSMSYADWQKVGFATTQTSTDASGTSTEKADFLYIPETGELILSENAANTLKAANSDINVTYEKKGFEKYDVRPEMYFDCTDHVENITYVKENQEIEYTVAFNQTLAINTQSEEIVDAGVARDIQDLEDAVQLSIDAHDKYDKIKAMMDEERYQDETSQKNLQGWLDAAKKECDYADENLKNIFGKNMTTFQAHFDKAESAQTKIGAKGASLDLTKDRMLSQKETFTELKIQNEDRDITEIIQDYLSAYQAYQASLQATGKASSVSLLNYI